MADGEKNSITKITFTFNVDKETIIPPFSSKVSRSLIIKLVGEDNPIFSYTKYKPYAISPIFHANKPLIRVEGGNYHDHDHTHYRDRDSNHAHDLIRLYPARDYTFSLTVLDSNMIMMILNGSKEFELFNSRFTISSIQFTVTTFHNIMLNDREFIMRFVTPTLLQLPKKWGGRKRNGNVLFPLPSLLIWSVAQHWNTHAPADLRIESCKRLAIYSNFSMIEMDYHLKPITVIYNKVSKPKGITGWVRWYIDDHDDMLASQLRRVLAYACYIGVGRSRSIGFGMIDIVTKGSTNLQA